MPICHILPGESEGDTAQLILNTAAIPALIKVLNEARDTGLAFTRLSQRDNVEFTLAVEVVPHERNHTSWREVPYAYLEGKAIRYDSRERRYDARLLARHLYAAKRKYGHDNKAAAAAMGVSLGFVSDILNHRGAKIPRHLEKVAAYCGTEVKRYLLVAGVD